MVDQTQGSTVCCMCGDVGFPDRLFQCSRCRFRFQHSYCSNYYSGSMELASSICDWCQSEVVGSSRNGMMRSSSSSNSSRNKSSSCSSYNNSMGYNNNCSIRSEYSSGERIKNPHNHHHHSQEQTMRVVASPNNSSISKNSGGGSSGVPSPRPNSHRRYKLLKDVMC